MWPFSNAWTVFSIREQFFFKSTNILLFMNIFKIHEYFLYLDTLFEIHKKKSSLLTFLNCWTFLKITNIFKIHGLFKICEHSEIHILFFFKLTIFSRWIVFDFIGFFKINWNQTEKTEHLFPRKPTTSVKACTKKEPVPTIWVGTRYTCRFSTSCQGYFWQ